MEEPALHGRVEGGGLGVGVRGAWGDGAVASPEELLDGQHEAVVGFSDRLPIELGAVFDGEGQRLQIQAAASKLSQGDCGGGSEVSDVVFWGKANRRSFPHRLAVVPQRWT